MIETPATEASAPEASATEYWCGVSVIFTRVCGRVTLAFYPTVAKLTRIGRTLISKTAPSQRYQLVKLPVLSETVP
jgi:hypothetical protein